MLWAVADGYDTTHTLTYNTIVENYYRIEVDGVTRNYLLVNIDPNDVSNIKNVLLCFPGGSESVSKFIDYTSFNYIDSPVIVFLGQQSINTYTWQNAFPWLYNNFNQDGVTITYQNDVKFVDTVLSNLFNNFFFHSLKIHGTGWKLCASLVQSSLRLQLALSNHDQSTV